MPRTFSRITSCGRSASTARATCTHNPVLVPADNPRRRPASLTSWQGKPAHSTSTGSTAAQSTALTSP
jgi:hypothetical protein